MLTQTLTSRIDLIDKPFYFRDVMIDGAFKSMAHDHHFISRNKVTIMIDIFSYKVPFGFIGYLFDQIVLRRYMNALLKKRNEVIKQFAESAA